jgi:hypothetical protein
MFIFISKNIKTMQKFFNKNMLQYMGKFVAEYLYLE